MKKNLLFAAFLVLVGCAPQEANAVDYTSAAVIESDTVRYSKLVINSCLARFKANTTYTGFQTYNEDGSVAAEISVNSNRRRKSG